MVAIVVIPPVPTTTAVLDEQELGTAAARHPDAAAIEAERVARTTVRTALLLEIQESQAAQVQGTMARRAVG